MKITEHQVVHFLGHVHSNVPLADMLKVLGKIRARRAFWIAAAGLSVIAVIVLVLDRIGLLMRDPVSHYIATDSATVLSVLAVWMFVFGYANQHYLCHPSNMWNYIRAKELLRERRKFVKLFGTMAIPDPVLVHPALVVQGISVIKAHQKFDVHVDSATRLETFMRFDRHNGKLKAMLNCAAHFIKVPSYEEVLGAAEIAHVLIETRKTTGKLCPATG